MVDRNDSSPTDGAESIPDADTSERNGFAASAGPADRQQPEPGTSSPATVTITRGSEDAPSHSVVRGVAAVTNTDPSVMQPLYDTIDPDALNRLFGPRTGTDEGPSSALSFRFNGCDVTVYADGRTTVTQTD